MKKNARNTKGKIVSAAWKLFYQQGYDNTTIEEIVEASGTSRGSFYHYFEGKDALLSSLSYLFDDKYVELEKTMDPTLSPIEKLKYMNQELFLMIENTVSVELLSRLFANHQWRAPSAQHQPDILQTAAPDHHRRKRTGSLQGELVHQRYHPRLRHVRARTDVRMVHFRRELLPVSARPDDHAAVFGGAVPVDAADSRSRIHL